MNWAIQTHTSYWQRGCDDAKAGRTPSPKLNKMPSYRNGYRFGLGASALKACPFCGNTPRYLNAHPGFYSERVICDSCEFHLPPEIWSKRHAA